ncbi:hypothetical protein EA472_11135 [Natrarchaeobius oligotrophus]|uniref:Uncharacterized protein n=1 Tax=Natrarchaeobius chitinivorans TaxID=1679083 RepID=A0A3N6MRX3_NATCH|nr:hypothetical protein EA472_11135 [Natrarchaeobius chitinivorans]
MFEGSNGRYYTHWQLYRNLERGSWRLCIYQGRPERYLVEAADRRLLLLAAIDPEELPDWVEIRIEGSVARVVDRRRSASTTTDGERRRRE